MLANKAIERNELSKYLAGYPEYKILNPFADSPTYPQAAFNDLEKELLKSDDFRRQFKGALLSVSEDLEYGWMALYYVRQCKSFEARFGINLVPDSLLLEIGKNLKLHQGSFERNKKWLGAMYSNGIWGDINSMNESLFEELGIRILPE